MWRVVVVVLLAVCVGGCEWWDKTNDPTGPSDPSGGFMDADLLFCVNETNRLRATAGRHALSRSSAAEQYAQAAAESDHASGIPHGYFSSHPVNGAENEVLRQAVGITARQAIQMSVNGFWSEGPGGGHYHNMANNWNSVGCGVVGSGGLWTVVQEFR